MTPDQQDRACGLMRAAQDGDQMAYASLLIMLTPLIHRFARSRLGNVSWLDDVVQETLVSVDRARHSYDPGRPFAPWFYTIASSRLVDVLRREHRIAAREVATNELPERGNAGASSHEHEIDVEAIHAALASLPGRQQEIIRSLKFDDQSVREVAGRLGMTESAVKVAAHRGYRALRRLLGDRTRED